MEVRHRGRARVEDSIRAGKDTGMRNLPHHAFEHNQTWLELSLIAQDLLHGEADLPRRRARHRGAQAPAPAAAAHRGKIVHTAGAPGSSSTATGRGPTALAAAFACLRTNPALG